MLVLLPSGTISSGARGEQVSAVKILWIGLLAVSFVGCVRDVHRDCERKLVPINAAVPDSAVMNDSAASPDPEADRE